MFRISFDRNMSKNVENTFCLCLCVREYWLVYAFVSMCTYT